MGALPFTMTIREILSSEAKWTKYNLAVDKNGERVGVHTDEAVAFCLSGAVLKAFKFSAMFAQTGQAKRLKDYLLEKYPDRIHKDQGFMAFNDHEKTTYADIDELITTLNI